LKSISFVIPAYNSSHSIEKCILSIIKLQLEIFEIIVIDDGSHDNSIDVVKNIINTNIAVEIRLIINNKNYGVSYSRNLGIDNAKYDYIKFVDCDDNIINNKIIFSSKNSVLCNDVDIFIFSYLQNDKDIFIEDYSFTKESSNLRLIEAYFNNPVGNSIVTYVWAKLYRTCFIKNNLIKFDTTKSIHEDILFNINCLFHSSVIEFVNEKIYNYNVCTNQKFKINQLNSFMDIYDKNKLLIPSIKIYKSNFISSFICKNIILSRNTRNFFIIFKTLKIYNEKKYILIEGNIKNKFLRFLSKSKLIKVPVLASIIIYLHSYL